MKTLFTLVILFSLNNLFSIEEEKIQPTGLLNGDGFGGSTCLKGDMLIVGAPFDDISGNDSVGSVQYFKRISGAWVFQGSIPSPDGTTGDFFGFTLDFNGTHLVIGAPHNDEAGTDAGAVYIYQYIGTSFSFVKKNMASFGAPGDQFGQSVAIYDTTIVVGTPKDDDIAPNAGAAYIFNFANNNWTQAQKITSTFPEFGNEFFGFSVSIHKNRILIGATLDDDAATDAGTAFVYLFNGTSWAFEQKLSPSDGASSHSFGFSTSINDSVLIVGAFGANNLVPSSGAAYIFRRNGTTWTEEKILFQADVNDDDWFGFDVAIEGNTVIVTALNNDEFVLNGGSVYLIRYDEVLSEWVPEYIDFANDGLLNWRYGFSCSLDGTKYVVGAYQATGSTVKSGAVYYYDICTHITNQSLCAVSADSSNTANYVLWKSPKTTLIDSFFVFRAPAGTNNYTKIGAVDYYDLDQWYDITDINTTAYSYKISTSNICGVQSDSSQKHSSILLYADDATGNIVLSWTVAQGYSYNFYRIYRDPEGDGTYNLLFAVVNSQFTFTDNNPTGLATTNYKIQAFNTAPCTGLSQPFSSTLSNASNPNLTGVDEFEIKNVFVYPNPTSSSLFISSDYPANTIYTIYNSLGVLIQSGMLSTNELRVASLENGMYLLKIENEKVNELIQFVKQ